MPPTQTPAPLTHIWGPTHGISPFYSAASICAAPGLLLLVGVSGLTLGVTSVVFDDATGEPLAFETNTAISPGTGPAFLNWWHFPDEMCVVLAGYKVTSVDADARVWARRVYYDLAGNLTTPDPLTTWSPGEATGAMAVGVVDSSTVNVMHLESTRCRTTQMDLAAGTVGTVNTYTINSIFGGTIDRTSIALRLTGPHPEAAFVVAAYNNAAGITTAQTYIIRSTGPQPTSTLVSTTRLTGGDVGVPEGDRSYMSLLGTLVNRLVDPSGLFQAVDPPTANFIYLYSQKSPRTGTGNLDSHNREDLTYGTVSGTNDKHRVREWDADTGAEVFAWEFPGSIGSVPIAPSGRMVKRGEFWFIHQTTVFNVYGGDYPIDEWFVGFVGART